MKLFENYLSGIEQVLDQPTSNFKGVANKRAMSSDVLLKANVKNTVKMFTEGAIAPISGNKALLSLDKTGLEHLFGTNKSSFQDIVIGSHPDFSDLGYNDICYHHCVSMFVDIKGSTRLALKNDLEKVRLIKDSLLTLCIHIANFFGGHIHRLQGDAVFVQFVRRSQHKNDAIINALNAASVLCQFVEKDLSEIFIKKGLTPIKVRVGIDYGNDEEVLWSHYGVPGCTELTTTSLHTDLAAKLQSKAGSNAIVIGDHIVKELDLPKEYLEQLQTTVSGQKQPDLYIINTNEFRYKQHEFLWEKYLPSFDFIRRSGDGALEVVESDFKLRCEITGDSQDMESYEQNSRSISKGKGIKFTIYFKNAPYHKQSFEAIKWEVHNRGEEAAAAPKMDVGGTCTNETFCIPCAAYLGHHYIACKIERPNSSNINMRFAIYVR